MSIGLHILLIYSIICFLKASIIHNMKVVPNDNFKFGGERVNRLACVHVEDIFALVKEGG